MVIKYIAYTWQGDKVEGVLDAVREQDARELLHSQELIPYRLTEYGLSHRGKFWRLTYSGPNPRK